MDGTWYLTYHYSEMVGNGVNDAFTRKDQDVRARLNGATSTEDAISKAQALWEKTKESRRGHDCKYPRVAFIAEFDLPEKK